MASDEQTRASFIRDILENPDDDGPRIVFADWLTQRGDPRGELISTQCLLEQATGGERARLFNRAYALQANKNLLADIRAIAPGIEIKRGFVYSITANAGLFAKHCGPLFDREPIEELRLKSPTVRDLATLRKAPHTAKLRSFVTLDRLRLNVAGDVSALAELLRVLTVRNLELQLAIADDAEEVVRELLARLALPTVQTMKLRTRSTYGGVIAAELATAKLPVLRQLAVHKDAVKPLKRAFPNATIAAIA